MGPDGEIDFFVVFDWVESQILETFFRMKKYCFLSKLLHLCIFEMEKYILKLHCMQITRNCKFQYWKFISYIFWNYRFKNHWVVMFFRPILRNQLFGFWILSFSWIVGHLVHLWVSILSNSRKVHNGQQFRKQKSKFKNP